MLQCMCLCGAARVCCSCCAPSNSSRHLCASTVADLQEKGYGIAIASANGNEPKMRKVLPLVSPETFNDDFFGTNAFQFGRDDKDKSLNYILDHFSTHPQCTMFFDDGW